MAISSSASRGLSFERVTHFRSEVPDDEHRLVPETLELGELPQDDGVPEVDVRSSGVDTELDAKGTALGTRTPQLLQQLSLG